LLETFFAKEAQPVSASCENSSSY